MRIAVLLTMLAALVVLALVAVESDLEASPSPS
jgi:hypothetical protein